MSKKLLIFPFGGNGREALLSVMAINSIKKEWDVLGFADDDSSLVGKHCCNLKVIGGKEIFKKHPDASIIAVPGNPGNYRERKTIIDGLGISQDRFARIIDPTSVVSPDAVIGYNTVLMSGVFISCGVKIGNHCIILPNTVISHDAVVGDYCLIGSNVSVSGGVKIDGMAYVGSGAKIRGGLNIGNGALVGLGSVVVENVNAGVIVAGNPARSLRKAGI